MGHHGNKGSCLITAGKQCSTSSRRSAPFSKNFLGSPLNILKRSRAKHPVNHDSSSLLSILQDIRDLKREPCQKACIKRTRCSRTESLCHTHNGHCELMYFLVQKITYPVPTLQLKSQQPTLLSPSSLHEASPFRIPWKRSTKERCVYNSQKNSLEPTHTAWPWETQSHLTGAFMTSLCGKTQWLNRFLLHFLLLEHSP